MKFLSSERLSQHKYKTPEGYLICVDAILARTGKQTYRKNEVFADSEDDSEIEVDRKPEEVFSPATLASFENKPITVEHPDEDVNAGNHNELSVGFVRDVHKGVAEGQDVMLGTLVITDAQTIEEIENGEHTDLSCGYDCDIIDEANPQQRNIRGNHVALCQCGRAGIARIVDSIKDQHYLWFNHEPSIDEIENAFYNKYNRKIKAKLIRKNDHKNYINKESEDLYETDKHERFFVIKPLKDSVKDEDIFKVDVSSAEDRDVSRFITEAQNLGFTTEDKGYTIYLKNGNRNMLNQLKARTHTTTIKFVDSVKDAQSVMFRGENTFIFANKDMIPERTHYKGDVEYNGKEYYYHEGFDTKRKYLVPITDSIQDYVGTLKDINSGYAVVAKKYYDRFGMNSNVDRVCKTLDEARYIKNSLSFKDGMYFIIIDCNNGYKITDELIQSSSEEAFDKNIATEIKSGKDPKQAAAIAYSIKRKNDSKKYEVSYVDGDVEHIHIVRAKDLKDAINNFKDGFYGGIEESKLRASHDFILKRLFAELDNLKKQPSSVKQENEYYDIKQQIEARAKQIRREFE